MFGMDRILDSLPGETVAVGDIVDALGQRAHGTVLLLLAVPNLVPIPILPGSTTIFGALIALVAVQLIVGQPVLWLPDRVRVHQVARTTAATWLARATTLTGHLAGGEDCLPDKQPEHGLLSRAVGLLALVHGVILALPIPFANFLPAIGVACLGAGLARCRRRPLLIALIITAATLLVIAFASRWLVRSWRR